MKHSALSIVIPIHSFHFVVFNLICVVHSFLRSHNLGRLEVLLQRIDKALNSILRMHWPFTASSLDLSLSLA